MDNRESRGEIRSKEYHIAKLKWLRFECSDELPTERIHPDDYSDEQYGKFKCRGNWWHGTLNEVALFEQMIPNLNPELTTEIDDFKRYIKSLDYSVFRTREEIDRANDYLDKIISLSEK